MLFPHAFLTLSLVAVARACTPGYYSCGNENGAPGPDGSIQVCNSSGNWQLSALCGWRECCHQRTNAVAECICNIAGPPTTLTTSTLSA
ncbi:hypothetical protein GGR57DRAFT_471802 [Xylariaceae sp. FL1272]|nr:hypothetical protein GGR57DRAFT_471802 [Xylariaceae sp. FL1272]